jgi:hypothetical protein
MEVELSQLKSKMESEKRIFINEQAQVANLRKELCLALSIMEDEQREKFKSKIPRV